ncbi:MAG TPA: DNA/RNA nuclease SfsA [Prolixibacteraceae bacterium]|nr:DNA/RNA nuclease SfsA [Prolixibacteraceae bacterium]
MVFAAELVHGFLIKRYKRFLADVKLDTGETVVAHCTNSGSMKSSIETGAEVYLSPVAAPARKTLFTWEMIKINGNWVGINTANPNKLAFEAISEGKIHGLTGYTKVVREVTFGDSRFDIYAENVTEKCFVEVKNVTMKEGNYALFPDAVTIRGQKHLNTLVEVKAAGMRAVMLYVIQRMDVDVFGPAVDIDPDYSEMLRKAAESGVEIIAMQAKVTPDNIEFVRKLPVQL